MLMQTNSYLVPEEKRAEHERLMRHFRQTLARLGCNQFEVYEQVASNWSPVRGGGRFVQIMRFRDRRHHQQVQEAERGDAAAQELIRQFCELIGISQQSAGSLFSVGFYSALIGPSAQCESQPQTQPRETKPGQTIDSHDFTMLKPDEGSGQQTPPDPAAPI